MKAKTVAMFSAIVLACTNILPAAEVPGWAVRFCKKNTEAPKVILKIGVPGDKTSRMYWTAWTSNEHPVIAVPDKYKDIKAIWVGVETDPPSKAVHICLQYDDKSTKKSIITGSGEAETQQSDAADCGCE